MNAQLSKILNHSLTIPISVGIGSFGIGAGIGYILGRRSNRNIIEIHEIPPQMEFDFDADDLVDIQKAGEEEDEELVVPFRAIKNPQAELAGEEFATKRLREAVKETVIEVEGPVLDDEEVVVQNIFAGDTPEWNYERELAGRSPTHPYVIHKDEFYGEELGYTQITLTYYEGDEIMSDEDDTPLYNYSSTVGPLLFGHGSGDPNVFHVRNDKLKAEYEVIHDPGHFAVAVLGLELENGPRVRDIKHSGYSKFQLD